MASIEKFEEIEAWQKARELTREIYRVTNRGAFLAFVIGYADGQPIGLAICVFLRLGIAHLLRSITWFEAKHAILR